MCGHTQSLTPVQAGLCILTSNSGKCKNDPCDSETAAVIETLNERNGGSSIYSHTITAHSLTDAHTDET